MDHHSHSSHPAIARRLKRAVGHLSTVIEMIEAGDVTGAVDLWERHLEEAAALTLEHLGSSTIIDLLDYEL